MQQAAVSTQATVDLSGLWVPNEEESDRPDLGAGRPGFSPTGAPREGRPHPPVGERAGPDHGPLTIEQSEGQVTFIHEDGRSITVVPDGVARMVEGEARNARGPGDVGERRPSGRHERATGTTDAELQALRRPRPAARHVPHRERPAGPDGRAHPGLRSGLRTAAVALRPSRPALLNRPVGARSLASRDRSTRRAGSRQSRDLQRRMRFRSAGPKLGRESAPACSGSFQTEVTAEPRFQAWVHDGRSRGCSRGRSQRPLSGNAHGPQTRSCPADRRSRPLRRSVRAR